VVTPLISIGSGSVVVMLVEITNTCLFVQTRWVGHNCNGVKSGKSMMLPLYFYYQDILHQYLLIKLNHTNIMEVPGSFEIRLVPKSTSDTKILQSILGN
jgi:hypothetical protein